MSNSLPLILLAVGVLFLLGAWDWRRGLFAALLLVILEGAIRKWLLPQASQTVYFAKDCILLGTYARFFLGGQAGPSFRFGGGLSTLLLVCGLWTFLDSFNPDMGSLICGLYGWKAYAFYIPICFMVPALFRNQDELENFLRYYLALAVPVCLLAIFQFLAPEDSPLNVYAPSSAEAREGFATATFGEDNFVRVTGTFSYISGFAAYLMFTLSMLLPMLIQTRSLAWRFVLGIALVCTVGSIPMTGSRSPALGGALILAGFAIATLLFGNRGERRGWWVQCAAIAVAVLATMHFFEKAVTALQERIEGSGEEAQARMWASVFEPFGFFGQAGIWGHGDGLTQAPVIVMRRVLHLPPAPYDFSSPTDSENTRVLMELGIPGFFLWYGMRLALVVALWRTRQRLASPLLRQFALGGVLYLTFQFFTATMFGPTSNVYHWFVAGFIMLLPKLEAQNQSEQVSVPARLGGQFATREQGQPQPRVVPWITHGGVSTTAPAQPLAASGEPGGAIQPEAKS